MEKFIGICVDCEAFTWCCDHVIANDRDHAMELFRQMRPDVDFGDHAIYSEMDWRLWWGAIDAKEPCEIQREMDELIGQWIEWKSFS